MSQSRLSMTVIPAHRDSRPDVISMPGEDSSGIISASSLAKGTGQRAAYGQARGLQNANMPKPV
jgi:hypothetical protein